MARPIKIYKEDFYKKLPSKIKEQVYQGTIELLKGYLSFDSTNVGGTGGGALLLAGRLSAAWGIFPILMSLCVEILDYQDMISNSRITESDREKVETDIEVATNKGEAETTTT